MIAVIGADPGKVTGLFAWSPVDDPWWVEVPPNEVRGYLASRLMHRPTALVAVERFVITRRTLRLSRQPDALKVTGVLEDAAAGFPGATVKFYGMSDAKRLASDDVLRTLGWYRRGADHATDAARVALAGIADAWPATFHGLMSSVVE